MAGKKSASAETEKPVVYKSLKAVFNAKLDGTLPRGAKFVIGNDATMLATHTKSTQTIFFEFKGTPAEFAVALLKHSDIKAEVQPHLISSATTTVDDNE